MISPGGFSIIIIVGMVVGILGYTYHEGKQSYKNVCEADKIKSQLIAERENTKNLKELNEYGAYLVGEAQKEVEQEKIKSDNLQKVIDKLNVSEYECVPDSVLDNLRKLRNTKEN